MFWTVLVLAIFWSLPVLLQKFLKIVHTLRFNETKVPWSKDFIDDGFDLSSGKE